MARIAAAVAQDRFVDDALVRASAEEGDRAAFIDVSDPHGHPVTTTYAEWERASAAFATWLGEQGVERGDVVILMIANSAAYPICYMGASRAGVITSGVNPRLGEVEFRRIVEQTRPAVTIVEDGKIPVDVDAGIVLERSSLTRVFETALRAHDPGRKPSDIVALVWTSGTTGMPKGAMFDHDNLRAVAHAQDSLTQEHDVYLAGVPYAHVGFTSKVWGHLAMRTTQVIPAAPWRAGRTLSLIEAYRVTVAGGVPAQWRLLLDHPDFEHTDFSSVRQVVMGGAYIEPRLVREVRARIGCPVVARYTCTEAAVTTGTDPDAPDEVVAHTVGTPVTGVELRLVAGDGTEGAGGEVGEIECRSRAMMRGYWQDAEATAAVFDGDWLRTGDLGRLRSDGNLEIVGRKKEMYIRGGYNVYPAEVEAVLAEHPGVAASAVVGVPDPVLGEVGVAVVVPTDPDRPPGLDDVRTWCGDRIADYKSPDRILFVDALPLTPMHKADRQALLALASAAFATRET